MTHDNGAYVKSDGVSGPGGCWHRDGFGYCAECRQAQRLVDLIATAVREATIAERQRVSEAIKAMDDWDDPNWDCIDFQAEILRIVNAR